MSEKPLENVTIERVRRTDFDQLEKLFASAFHGEVEIEQLKRRIRRAHQFYYLLQPLSRFSMWIKNHFNIYVVKFGAKVVGFIQISFLNPVQMHIDYLAFSKQCRGQGLGRWVLSKLLANVADVNDYDVVLEVRVDNPAYRFYQRLGFRNAAEILHYELHLGSDKAKIKQPAIKLEGFRPLAEEDRAKLYYLYQESVSAAMRQVVKRMYREFNPSMMVRHLDSIKSYLMRKRKQEYVIEREGKIVAWLTVVSYLKVKSHVISLILHPDFERLRLGLLTEAVSIIAEKYSQGVITTTIYNDDLSKKAALENLGFNNDLAYYLMYRPSVTKRREAVRKIMRTKPVTGKHFKNTIKKEGY